MSRYAIGTIAVVAAVAAACNSQLNPTAPNTLSSAPSAALRSAGSHGQPLTAVLGAGSGIVNVSPTSAADGFSAQITVNVHGAPPNTTFYVQRAPEIGRPNGADGICQRAAGEAPWGPPAPNFLTFPVPAPGPLVTLHTSPGGAGAVHIAFAAAGIADDTAFDVMFRLVDDLGSPANELRTPCFTVTAK